MKKAEKARVKTSKNKKMSTYTKARLLEMNADPTLGRNWIINIANIGKNELAKIYPSGNASLASGRIYVALPATLEITEEIELKYNLWL